MIPRGSPPVVRGRGFSLTDRLPPLGRRGSLVELQQRGLEELDRKRLKRGKRSDLFSFFDTPLRLSLAVTLFASTRAVCSRRAATTSDRHNLRRALKGPSRCRNVSQAAMSPFNFNYKFPLVGFASICSEAQRLVFTVGIAFVLNIRRFRIWMCGRQQRCMHLAT